MEDNNPELPGIGVFGTGMTVKCLIPILQKCGFKARALWGKTQQEAAECAKDLEIDFYTTKVDQMLLHKDVHLVFIDCPPLQQSPIAVKALGIGKHVICGTPTGPTQLEVLRMVNAAEYYPSLMSLMCSGLRFLPCFTKMKTMLDNGMIGNVLVCEVRVHCGSLLKDSFDWLCDSFMGGGVLNIYGSVFVDLICFLLNKRATHATGTVRTFVRQTDKINGFRCITSDDFCSFQLDFPDDIMATFQINSHASHEYQQEVVVCGSKGRLVVRGCDLMKGDGGKEDVIHRDVPSILDIKDSRVVDSISANIPVPHIKGLLKLIDHLKEAFKSQPEMHGWSRDVLACASTFTDEHHVQAILEAVRKSSRLRKTIKVELLKEEPREDGMF